MNYNNTTVLELLNETQFCSKTFDQENFMKLKCKKLPKPVALELRFSNSWLFNCLFCLLFCCQLF